MSKNPEKNRYDTKWIPLILNTPCRKQRKKKKIVDQAEEPDPDAGPLADPSKWEHRKIQNVVWARRQGHVVDTVIIDHDDDGETTEDYVIDETLMQMIRASPHNTRQIKSKVINPNSTSAVAESSDASEQSDSDNGSAQVESV